MAVVPRLVEALAGKRIVGAAAGFEHAAAWTEDRELFTFGKGCGGRLGHGDEEDELVPRLVEAVALVALAAAWLGALPACTALGVGVQRGTAPASSL